MPVQAPSAQAFVADANGILQKIGSDSDILSLASPEHRVIDLQRQHVVPVSIDFFRPSLYAALNAEDSDIELS